ncbi:MAG: LysR family transcriptional regulator [Candidatus Puniceispirillaceae bacterium]
MKLDKLNYFLLRVFKSILRTRNISETARELCMTQPAISNALNRLREMLNDALFVRRSSSLILTPKAEQLAPEILSLLEVMDDLSRISKSYDPFNEHKHFRIGVTPGIRSLVYNKILQTLSGFDVSLEFLPVEYVYAENATAYIDADLILGLVTPPKQLKHQLLFSDNIVVVGRKDHSVLSKNDFTLEDYLSLQHIIIHDIPDEYNPLFKIINGKSDSRRIFAKIHEYHEFTHMIDNTDFIITTSRLLANTHQKQHDNLIIRDLPVDVSTTIPFYAAWPEITDNIACNIWLREQLLELQYTANDDYHPNMVEN